MQINKNNMQSIWLSIQFPLHKTEVCGHFGLEEARTDAQ